MSHCSHILSELCSFFLALCHFNTQCPHFFYFYIAHKVKMKVAWKYFPIGGIYKNMKNKYLQAN